MDNKQIHKPIVIGICLIAAFASYMALKGIGDVYHTSASFFEGSEPYYPYLFTLVVATVPIVLFIVAYLVHKNRKPMTISVLAVYSLVVYLSYPTIVLIVLIIIWWFLIYRTRSSSNE
jgi:hypothetical protein